MKLSLKSKVILIVVSFAIGLLLSTFLHSQEFFKLLSEVKVIFKGNTKGKKINLVICDGPTKHTEKLLKILRKHKIKATFCFIGTNVDKNPKLAEEVKKEKHIVCTQLYEHKKASAQTDELLWKNTEKAKYSIAKHLKEIPTIYMPPFLDVTTDYIYATAKYGAIYIILPEVEVDILGKKSTSVLSKD